MKPMFEIIAEIREASGTNAKKEVLKKYQSDVNFKMLLKVTYDPRFKYWITDKQFNPQKSGNRTITQEFLVEALNPLLKREVTGHAARDYINSKGEELIEEEQEILKLVLKRDLRISLNRKSINSVYGDYFVFDPPYMRCQVLNDKTMKNIQFPAYCQLKADGMFVNIIHKYDKENDKQIIELMSRQGERLFHLETIMRNDLINLFKDTHSEDKDFVIHGECLIDGLNDRKISNGILNRDEIPKEYHSRIYVMAWDVINYDHWIKRFSNTPYDQRFKQLEDFLNNHQNNRIKLIPNHEVNNFDEVFQIYSDYVSQGLEGAIVKNKSMLYKHHDSPDQLKVKIKIEVDLKLIGFNPGTGKFESTFGSLKLISSDGLLESNVSGITDKDRKYLWENKDDVIGKIVEVEANDLFEPNESTPEWRLSHPRFKGIRTDKVEADSLDRIKEIVESARKIQGESDAN